MICYASGKTHRNVKVIQKIVTIVCDSCAYFLLSVVEAHLQTWLAQAWAYDKFGKKD